MKGAEVEQDGEGKRVRKRVLKLVGRAEARKSSEVVEYVSASLEGAPMIWRELSVGHQKRVCAHFVSLRQTNSQLDCHYDYEEIIIYAVRYCTPMCIFRLHLSHSRRVHSQHSHDLSLISAPAFFLFVRQRKHRRRNARPTPTAFLQTLSWTRR